MKTNSTPLNAELVKLHMEAAQRSLDAGQYTLDGGFSGVAATRAYYACFYAANALLLTRNMTRSKHSGVLSAICCSHGSIFSRGWLQMIRWLPTHITASDQQAIEALVSQLMLSHGSDILFITLFGSKARGEDTLQSDIDVLVVVTKEDWHIKHEIRILGARVSLNYDVLFNLYVIEQERWAWMEAIKHPLYRQIVVQGIALTPVSA
jgi:predicted nucleotidyltransferase